MPWNPSDAPHKDKDANTAAKKERWASTANSVRRKAMAQGMSEGAASARAIKVANKVVK